MCTSVSPWLLRNQLKKFAAGELKSMVGAYTRPLFGLT